MSLTPEELSQQIKEARAKQATDTEFRAPTLGEQNGAGIGAALRVSSELVGALVFGGFLGYWLDRWLHTMPLFLILFFFLGFGAGFLNIYRTQMGKKLPLSTPGAPDEEQKTDKEEK